MKPKKTYFSFSHLVICVLLLFWLSCKAIHLDIASCFVATEDRPDISNKNIFNMAGQFPSLSLKISSGVTFTDAAVPLQKHPPPN